jgi:cytochrome c556
MKAAPAVMLIGAVLSFASTAAAQQPPASKSAASSLQVMKSTVIPASDVVFKVGEKAPKSDQEWAAVQDSAAKLAAASKILLMQAPSTDNANWLKYSNAMSDAAESAGKAARTKNVDAVLDAGEALYATCESCHKQYLKK